MACVICASPSPCYQELLCREKESPNEAGSVQTTKAPPSSITNHQGGRVKDSDAGRAQESRNVRADRTAWLSGCSSSLRCCHISSDTHLQPPYHKHLQHLEIASPQIHDLDIISYHRQATGIAKRLAIDEVGQVRNFEDDIGVPKGSMTKPLAPTVETNDASNMFHALM
ncbi:hypothetical protein Q7P35_010882 [Cladosporium inversicolor]